jgi:hypothetical protein
VTKTATSIETEIIVKKERRISGRERHGHKDIDTEDKDIRDRERER